MNNATLPRSGTKPIPIHVREIEGREWWVRGFAVAVTLVLTFGVLIFDLPRNPRGHRRVFPEPEGVGSRTHRPVLLFDMYTVYQHLQLRRIRRRLAERDRPFQVISENAADMNRGGRLRFDAGAITDRGPDTSFKVRDVVCGGASNVRARILHRGWEIDLVMAPN